MILLDYSKEFDTISYKLLISILHFAGFSNQSIELLNSYLRDRLQYIETSLWRSDKEYVKYGVPQGSILELLLFSIYTNNIYSSLSDCNNHFYADDTQIY